MHRLSTAARGLLLSLAIVALALTVQVAPALADASPTGRTVKEIGFSTGDAAPLGGFRLVKPGSWQEFDKNGIAVFTYSEQARDDWSVYLHDAARNVDIQLDLHTRQVLYAASGQAPYPIYVILFAMSDPPTGRTVTRVDFSIDGQNEAGRYLSAGNGQWVEVNAPGQVAFTFQETSRDDWSVYLRDPSRGVDLQLDLKTDTVYYAETGGTLTPLYKIILEQ